MQNREISIDVLRGLAIVGMVLSGTISRNPDLPAWLYHAQIAPPDFSFNPELPGLTWVDLVFPFFLFAMGMAFPFALNKSVKEGATMRNIAAKIINRSIKLLFFAVLLGHLSPFHYPAEMGWLRYFMGFLAFAGFFMAFSKFPHFKNHESKINIAGYIFLASLLIARTQVFDAEFSPHSHDIIILVLANMAFFGGLTWYFTRNNWYVRLGIMALYFAIRLTQGVEGSINQMLWDFTPLSWLAGVFPAMYETLAEYGLDLKRTLFYNPDFLKYLMIVIPGSIAGDLIYKGIQNKSSCQDHSHWTQKWIIPAILFANLAFNLWGLQSRSLNLVWLINLVTIGFLAYQMKLKKNNKAFRIINQLLGWSIFWLLLGLVFEAWEGGIKKDHATLSYFFLTSGLSGFMIVFFKMVGPVFQPGRSLGFLALTGMNPLLGYVAASYFIMPVLYFAQLLPWMDQWHESWHWAGLLRGVILTGIMIWLTVFSVRKKYYWKT